MNQNHITSIPEISRERLIQMLNKDLAIEYQSIIAFIVYSHVLKRACHTDIALELERHAAEDFQHARKIAKQIAYLGGVQCVSINTIKTPDWPDAMLLSSIVRNLEYEVDLVSLLGMGADHANRIVRENPSKRPSPRVRSAIPKSVMSNHKNRRRNTAKRYVGKTGAWPE